jgi:peptidyl-dipeptidase Dcp
MKNLLLLAIALGVFMISCGKQEETAPQTEENPFFVEWDTPFGTAPFEKINDEHYMPAFEKAIAEKKQEIQDIANNTDEPTFENTIEAIDYSGALLTKVSGVFYNLTSANTNDKLQEISKEIAPKMSALNDDINLNENLFKRVKTLYDKKDELGLNPEQMMLLEKYYKGFVRGGANLPEDKKERFREINEKLALLTLQFGEHVLKETNKFEMVLDNEEDLAGLPESVKAAAKEAAAQAGYEGKWLFTIHKPSLIPFITYSDKRELREKMLKAYNNVGNNDDELDNKKIAAEIAKLRVERANLLGYDTHADFVLEENMAKTPDKVYELLMEIWKPALERAKAEAKDLQTMIDAEGNDFKLEPWDWWYYAEKLRKEKYDLDEEELRPYFAIDNVRDGVFKVANNLYGITFEERNDISKYHDEVTVFEVKDADGSHIGIFYTDYHPRASKRGGAWMNAYRSQMRTAEGNEVSPIICNVCNFTKPTADKPALLTFEEVETLFHEFGHALHGLLADTKYPSLSGTNVARDFVELPSQIMEHWASEPEVLKMYAKHYETGEAIPDELITKIQNSSKFNQGFVTTEFLSAAFLDMDWHTMTEPKEVNTMEFEKNSLDKIGLIDEIVVRYRSPYFRHIFSGGYSSGYYSYIWSGVLDADAFKAFKETGNIFDKETATKFRDNVLSQGGTVEPMELYVRFRGSEPSTEPLLEVRGLN